MKPTRSLALIIVAGIAFSDASGQYELENAFPNLSFSQPVDLQHAGDASDRLFLVEQQGRIRVFQNDDGVSTAKEFLDISGKILSGSEMGLLGLAFHPEYETNGYFFVNYTMNGPARTVVARYRVDSVDADAADPSSELILLEVLQPFSNHNGGQIAFGTDGYLYISFGDGGDGGDPQGHGQNRSTLLGTIARIDVDNPVGQSNYGIPPDNPFAGDTSGYREEIFAYGLRNPWRFSIDSASGRIWTADVGQNRIEEIDIIEKGRNYGWKVMEGTLCFSPATGCDTTGLTMPAWEYGRSLGNSVTGGYVYRGSLVPELAGKYIYGDFGSGRIWALTHDGVNPPANEELLASGLLVSSFGVDQENELYVLGYSPGRVYKFKSSPQTSVVEEITVPRVSRLLQNYPNPFNPTTEITYVLDEGALVEIRLFDVQGRFINSLVNEFMTAGRHTARWNGSDFSRGPVSSGTYYYQLSVDGLPVDTRSMLLVK
jgi:glucose/arabinose dehydrogenase